MAIIVRIPASLRPLTGGNAEVALESATTVQAAVDELERRHPGVRTRLLDDRGALRRYINVFKGDEDIKKGGALATALKDGDQLTIVPAIAGGHAHR